MKTCSRCKNTLPIENFTVRKTTNKVDGYCKKCRKEYSSNYQMLRAEDPVFKEKKKIKDICWINRNSNDLGDWYLRNTLKREFPNVTITDEMIHLKREYLIKFREHKELVKLYTIKHKEYKELVTTCNIKYKEYKKFKTSLRNFVKDENTTDKIH